MSNIHSNKNIINNDAALTNKNKSLCPIFKWTGGKRRELKFLVEYLPSFIEQGKYSYVEPFIGGGAMFFHLNNLSGENIINDFDSQVVNFYVQFANGDPSFIKTLQHIGNITEHDLLENQYYNLRNADKNGELDKLSKIKQAIRFFVVNQLAFSGMRRFNSKGEFNVPFGHYKRLNTDIISSDSHRILLNKTSIYQGDFQKVMQENDKHNTLIFLDPPYTRIFKKYSSDNSFGENEHKRLAETVKQMKMASVLLVIDRSVFTEKLYKEMIKTSYNLKYGVNIKNRFDTEVEHLIITNY